MTATANRPTAEPVVQRSALAAQLKSLPAEEAGALLERTQPQQAADALQELNPALVSPSRGGSKGRALPHRLQRAPEIAEQWKRNASSPRGRSAG